MFKLHTFSRIKKIVLFVFIAAFAVFTSIKLHRIDSYLRAAVKTTKQFSPAQITCQFEPNPAWDVKVPDDLFTFVNVITQQPFHYLAKGFQAYAFLSQDGEYVLKFFQQQRLREKSFKEYPFAYLFSKDFHQKAVLTKNHRIEIFSGSKLVFEEAREECGFLFVHLNQTQNLLRGIRLVDAQGQSHKIKADQVSFIVQRRANYVLPTINELMKKNDLNGAKCRLDQIFDLLLTLAHKGIVDGDHALIRNNNIGFVKDRAIYIDTGHVSKTPNLDIRKHMDYEFKKRLKPLQDWLKINYPELAQYYEERSTAIMLSLQNEPKSTQNTNMATNASVHAPLAQ